MVAMTSMLAVVQTGYGSPERVLRVQEVERPSAGDGEVLIRVRATSVNTPDWLMVTGVPYVLRAQFGLRGPKSPIRGTDVAGVVEAIGTGVSDLEPGDEVFGSLWDPKRPALPHGTFAEFTVAPAVPADQEAGRAVVRGSRRRRDVGTHRARCDPRRRPGGDRDTRG